MDSLLVVLEDVVAWLFHASWQASVLVGVVLTCGWLLRKQLTARGCYLLWLIVLARLALPIVPESRVSLFNLLPATTADRATEVSPMPVPNLPGPDTSIPSPQPVLLPEGHLAADPANAVAAANKRQTDEPVSPAPTAPSPVPRFQWSLWRTIAVTWLVGVVFLFARTFTAALRLSRYVSRLQKVSEPEVLWILQSCLKEVGIKRPVQLLATRDESSPAIAGLFRPRLLIPDRILNTFSPEQLRFIFLHELAHVRCRDLTVNWLVVILQNLHWFNPIIWYGFHRLRADQELACDELVLSRTQPAHRQDYGQTMIRLLENTTTGRPMPLAVTILNHRALLKRRMVMIARFRHPSRARSMLGIVLLLLLLGAGLTDAVDASFEKQSRKNLQQIALALHNYNDKYGALPADANVDSAGKRLLSWRVHILEFRGAEGKDLYKQFHLNEPWDSLHNSQLVAKIPKVYQLPHRKPLQPGKTCYLVPCGARTIFPPNYVPGSKLGTRLTDVYPEGLSNIILVVEADRTLAVPWTKPQDLAFDDDRPLAGLGSLRQDGFLVSWASGRVTFIPNGFEADRKDRIDFLSGLFSRRGSRGIPYLFGLK